VLIVVDPQLSGSAGFALSVLATGGLLLLAPRWRDSLRRKGVPAGLAEALAVPAAAQAACAPLIAGLFGTFSVVAVPANLLAVPAVAPATVVGVGAALLSPLWPVGAQAAAWVGSWPAWWLVVIARYGAQTPAATLPWRSGVVGAVLLAALFAGALIATRHRWPRRLIATVLIAVIVGALPVRLLSTGWPPPGWLAVACAVGQGDSVVLAAGVDEAVVVDAGPEPALTDACLHRLGVRRVPLLVVSHFHVDHVGGIAGVFRGRQVDAIATTGYPEPAAGRGAVAAIAAEHRVPIFAVPPQWQAVFGTVALSSLGPNRVLTGTRSDPNNNSLVLRATIDRHSILLAGDAEVEEQHSLLTGLGGEELRADVLKLAHHGSAYQDPAFLDAVQPGVALVSVGVDNVYGHPNPAVLARLARDGVRVLRTDRDGDLAATVDGERLAVVSRGVDPGRRPP
jgi:competence protein ComEC